MIIVATERGNKMDDTVYRKDVIDTMEKIMADHPIDGYEDECLLINAMKSLPSADPEPSQLAKDIARIFENDQDMRVILKNAESEIVLCKNCKYRDENWRRVSVRWLPCMDVQTGSNWYCGSAERREDE